jgi:hypothetical protein
VTVLRPNSRKMQKAVDNELILLMVGEANAIDPAQLRAVVMETTGTISVLHGDPGGPAVDPLRITGRSPRL